MDRAASRKVPGGDLDTFIREGPQTLFVRPAQEHVRNTFGAAGRVMQVSRSPSHQPVNVAATRGRETMNCPTDVASRARSPPRNASDRDTDQYSFNGLLAQKCF